MSNDRRCLLSVSSARLAKDSSNWMHLIIKPSMGYSVKTGPTDLFFSDIHPSF